MLFPTLNFALFFFVVFVCAWALRPHAEARKLLLLATSYFFYACWDWRFLALLAGSSTLNYVSGELLARIGDQRYRRWLIIGAVTANLAVLGFFKYYEFFLGSLGELLRAVGWQRDMPFLEIVLPIGISFFTFHGICYVVDIYRRQLKPARSAVDLFLYITFFPQLVAGPIVRAQDFLPQLERQPELDRFGVTYGFILILSGMLKKTVIAHYLAVGLVDPAFAAPATASSGDLIAAHYAYAIQVYCDFSGYSDIAIGTAALLGIRFRKNFDRPFSATSLQQLWQRWHISLSHWLRDYLYRSLRGRRRDTGWRMYRNMFLTMLLGGLWHGANWTFVIWGAIHGAALVVERIVLRAWHEGRAAFYGMPAGSMNESRTAALVASTAGWVVTFHIFTLSAIFFRSPELDVATTYFAQMFSWSGSVQLFTPFLLALIVGSLAVQFLPAHALERTAEKLRPLSAAWLGLLFGGGLVFIDFIGPEGVAPFIYFQF